MTHFHVPSVTRSSFPHCATCLTCMCIQVSSVRDVQLRSRWLHETMTGAVFGTVSLTSTDLVFTPQGAAVTAGEEEALMAALAEATASDEAAQLQDIYAAVATRQPVLHDPLFFSYMLVKGMSPCARVCPRLCACPHRRASMGLQPYCQQGYHTSRIWSARRCGPALSAS